jgi:agmatine deiminase
LEKEKYYSQTYFRKMKKILLLTVFVLIAIFDSWSQTLPNYLTDDEKKLLPLSKIQKSPNGFVTPPNGPVRNPAEWEEMQAVLISWAGYSSFLTEIVRAAVEECQVYIYCSSETQTKNTLINAGVDVSNVHFIVNALNTVWIRDFGPNNIYSDEVGELALVDWIYNRPRPEDDASPQVFADLTGIPLYETTQEPTDLVNTGGNFMSDGFGTAFCEKLILSENEVNNDYGVTPKSEQEIDAIMYSFMGIERYIKIENLPNDGIHHIDMHMKLLDEETILVGEFPEGVSDGPQIEENLEYIANNFYSVFGTPYRIIRIPMPPSTSGTYPGDGAAYRTYTNSLIINKTIIFPLYREEFDTIAYRVYRDAMPGYKLVGIDCDYSSGPIFASGAMHCTTHEIAAENPLLISHQRLSDTDNNSTPYYLEAKILHSSGIESATIYYRTDTLLPYNAVEMTFTNSAENLWSGFIPEQSTNSIVYYYIEAVSTNGKTQVRPMTAPAGYWKFKILNVTNNTLPEYNRIAFKLIDSKNIQDELRVEIISPENEIMKYSIFNIFGQMLEAGTTSITKGKNKFNFELSNYSSGSYIIHFKSDLTNKAIQFIKLK